MVDTQEAGVEHCSIGSARVAFVRTIERTVVNSLTAQGRSAFAEVDADLVCAAGLQTTFDEGEIPEFLDNGHVRDGALAFRVVVVSATASSVSSVANELRDNLLGLCLSADQSQILAFDGVLSHLQTKMPLGFGSSCEDNEPARIFVEAMDGPDSLSFLGGVSSGQHSGQDISESWRQELLGSLTVLGCLMLVTNRCHSCRFVHDDDVFVDIADGWGGA